MKKRNKFLILLLPSLLLSCGNGNSSAEQEHKKEEVGEHHENEIIIDKHHVDELGIKTAKITPVTFREVIAVSGEVAPAQGAMKSVVAKTSGIVAFYNNVTEGAAVGKGGLICNISSDGILGGDPNKSAKIAYESAKAEYERIQPLYEKKIVTAGEYKEAKEAYDLAENAYLGGKGSTTVVSPLSGIVTQLLVENGAYVDAGTAIAVVSENRRLTLRAYLPKKYYEKLASLKTANFKLPYSEKVYDLSEMNGRKITSDNAATSGGYIDVAFDFDNTGGIVPGTYAEIYLLGSGKENSIVLPVQSVTEEMGYFYAYVEHEKGCYEKRRIDIGGCDGKNIEILSGLKAGESVVTEGAVLVKIAANSSAVPEGHHHH